jgi:hypothetical protein
MKYILDYKKDLMTISLIKNDNEIISHTYLKGLPLKASIELLESWISKDIRGFKSFENSYKESIEVSENLGVKITLLCLVTNCLRKLDRIRGIVRTLENMTWEEIFYWYSKCRGKSKNKGLKAFRILFDNV